MPEKGWRKKIHPGRPKSPLQPRPLDEETAPPDEQPERRRPQASWRKTIHGSRPGTPVGLSTRALGAVDDKEDTSGEQGSRTITPHRRSAPKPKLSRYLSGYLALTGGSKEPEFYEPWGEEPPLGSVPAVDPLIPLQSVQAYLCRFPSQPLPVPQNNNVLLIFEEYRKLRAENERLGILLKESLDGYEAAEESWSMAEGHYQGEIRRLELIILRGTAGMPGLIRARQGSIVERRRTHKRRIPKEPLETVSEFLSRNDLDEQIRATSRKVLLHRPFSPSGKMTALSRHFSSTSVPEHVPIGGPSNRYLNNLTLARRVKSELDLAKLGYLSVSDTTSQSMYSEFSFNGDPLPDEREYLVPAALDAAEGEAFIALRELAVLVARRKGMDTERFLSQLMGLFSVSPGKKGEEVDLTPHLEEPPLRLVAEGGVEGLSDLAPGIQHSPLANDRSRRHFSFEPGDDDLKVLGGEFEAIHAKECDVVEHQLPKNVQDPSAQLRSQSYTSDGHALEVQKPSKIPSPVTTMGRIRQETSLSSSNMACNRTFSDDGHRRDSRSSILTAFRQNSAGSLRPQSQSNSTSRSSSINNLRQAEGQGSATLASSPLLRNNVVALAAARAAGKAGSSSNSKGSSPSKDEPWRLAPTPSKARRDRLSVKEGLQNDVPPKRS